ncbi:repeat domain protein, partial [Rhodopirellula maiorica SM1]
MLTPESVGTFIQVGDDDPGLLHRMTVKKQRPEKHDPSYAHGLTSTKRMLITRGNLDRSDDVQLEKGQTWISISSPSEGTSRVTVLAPESECWDQRKATATIYWIDARWQFPGSQIVPAGTPVSLTTRVTRAEGSLPARGWKVRYEVQQPEIATFAGTNGSSVAEAVVDENGNATV